jgi:hypothetical protein
MILASGTYHTLGSLSLSESEDFANLTLYESEGMPGCFMGSG